jgi:hypothetical protein
VTVENDIQAETMRSRLHDITAFCRDRLSNDSILFDIAINQGESSPITWNEREVLAHMLERQNIKDFVASLKLTLS